MRCSLSITPPISLISNKSEVRVYDVSTSATNGPFFTRLFDTSNSRGSGNLALRYLPTNNVLNRNRILIGGNDGTLKLWNVPSSCSKLSGSQGRLVWSINPWKSNDGKYGGITEIVHLAASPSKQESGLILIATSIGYFALIDMNKCSRKSFSSNPTPQVLKTWNLSQLRGLRNHVLPSSKWMGVEKCHVWTDMPNLGTVDSTVQKSVELAVVTSGGWVISLRFDVNKNGVEVPIAKVLHRSPTVVKYDPTESTFYDDDPTAPASVPKFASVYGSMDNAASLIVVTKTKRMYQALPDQDKRILDNGIVSRGVAARSKKDGKDGLTLINRNGGTPITIPISEGHVQQLAIHPDSEWMVASISGTSSAGVIQLMNLKSRTTKKKTAI